MHHFRNGRLHLVAALAAVSLLSSGCTATRARRGTPEESGFLRNYSQLAENPDYPAALVYVRPGVPWSRYDSIILDSAGLWITDETKGLSAEDQQMLTDKDCSVILCLAGSLFSAGLKKVVLDMVENDMVDAIVSTGAIMVDRLTAAESRSSRP